jgi:hypothetical protein
VVYFGNFGFVKPSQSHSYLSFITRVISLALDEFVTLGETLTTNKFSSQLLDETIVISELLDSVVARVRNLAETIMIEQGGFIGDDFVEDDFDIEWEVTRVVTKFRAVNETVIVLSDAVTFVKKSIRALAESISISDLATITGGKILALTESITVGETLTRALIKLRPIIVQEAVTVTEALTFVRTRGRALADTIVVSEVLSRALIKSKALADSIGIGETLTRALIKLRSPNIVDAIVISEVLTSIKTKGKLLTETINIGETPAMIRSKFRDLAESISITDLLQRGKSIPKALADTITISDLAEKSRIRIKSISETAISITDQVIRLKPVVRSITEAAITITDSVVRLVTTFVKTWILSSHSSDFPSRLDGLVISYITSKWTATDPLIGGTAPTLQNENVNIGNYDYDKFRTYYIKVTEGQAVMHNRLRDNLYGFETPIEFECWARRLSKGEAFDQLNNIINELLRILIEYQAEDIFGVQGVLFDSITPLETTGNVSLDSAAKTLWRKSLRVRLSYYKVNLLRGTTP